MLEHLRSLQTHPALQGIPIVLAVESNLGFEAAHNARYVAESGIKNVLVAHEQSKKQRAAGGDKPAAVSSMAEYAMQTVGVRTTAESKERMYIMVRTLLEDDTLIVSDDLVCRGEATDQVDKLIKQMHNYSAVHSEAKTAFQRVKRVFSGKAMGEQDDLLISLMIAVMYRRVFMQNVEQS